MSTSTGEPAVERVYPPDWLVRAVNPVVRFLLRRGVPRGVARRLMLLHLVGRRTGRRYEIPVGHRRIDGRLAVLTSSRWRANLRDGQRVEVTLDGRRRPAAATLTEDPDEVAAIYDGLIDEVGVDRAGRELGIRINVDRRPTRAELREMVERAGLSVVWLDLDA